MPPKPARILVLDDHRDSLELCRMVLRDLGHEATPAQSVAEALLLCERMSFDLLISDIKLRDGSGLDVMRELRERCGVRGIALSGMVSAEDVPRSIEAGFIAHLKKPVELEKLEQAIAGALEL